MGPGKGQLKIFPGIVLKYFLMRDMPIYRVKETNPATRAAHKRQVFWQITAPFVVFLLIVLALMVLTIWSALGGEGGVSRWADISLIWLILPNLAFTLIFTAIVAALVYGLVKLSGVLPEVTFRIQEFLASLQIRLREISDSAARPVIKVGGFWASVRALFRR